VRALHDLGHALRALRKSPVFLLAATLTLALGIGANAAIFTMADVLVFHAFGHIDPPERVLWIFENAGKVDMMRDTVEAANFADWRAQTRTIDLAALRPADHTLTGSGAPERMRSVAVSADYFRVLGTPLLQGRAFLPADEQPGTAPIAILGEHLWRRRFASDPQLVGRTIELDGRPTTVVGVAPDLVIPRRFEVYVPLQLSAADWKDRKAGAFAALARLRDGTTLTAAQAEIDVVARRLADQYRDTNKDLRVSLVPLPEVFDLRAPAYVLLAGVAFVLLIACANVANLQLARGLARNRELAVRQAVGASRGALLRLLTIEALVVALAGAGLGLALSRLAWMGILAAIPASVLERMPQLADAGMNRYVLGFALLLAGAATLLTGLLPGLRSSRIDLSHALKEGAPGAGSGRRRRRAASGLVVAQVALALVLAVGASVSLRSFLVQRARPLGFRADGVFTMTLPLASRYPDAAARRRLVAQLLPRLRALPGVADAAVTTAVPMGAFGSWSFSVVGRDTPREQVPWGYLRAVTPELLGSFAIPLRRGRGIESGDIDEGPGVVLISDSIARRVFPGQDPIGQRIVIEDQKPREIVGVVGDTADPRPRSHSVGDLYVPYAQDSDDEIAVVLEAAEGQSPLALGPPAQAVVRELDPLQVIERPLTIDRVVSEVRAAPRLIVIITFALAALALALAAIGIYGVVAYAVGQRRREIGIRVALGASGSAVLRTVLGRTAVLAGIGLLLGLALSLAVVRGLSQVFVLQESGVALPVALVALITCAIVALASWLPARRALETDPLVALRAD
jgi:putative ABC transport system permease protein